MSQLEDKKTEYNDEILKLNNKIQALNQNNQSYNDQVDFLSFFKTDINVKNFLQLKTENEKLTSDIRNLEVIVLEKKSGINKLKVDFNELQVFHEAACILLIVINSD